MSTPVSAWALLPAAGSGSRMGLEIPKQFLPVRGRPVIMHTLEALLSHTRIEGAVVAVNPLIDIWRAPSSARGKPVHAVSGGAERADSVLAGLQYLSDHAAPDDWVLVHDAARPNLHHADLDKLFATLDREGTRGALLATRIADTIKREDASQAAVETVPRDGLWRALTPQVFRLHELVAALTDAKAAGVQVTDESMAMERAGVHATLVEGRADNLKITTPADLELIEFLLRPKVMPGDGSWDL